MEKKLELTSNHSSIYDLLSHLAKNSLLLFSESDVETLGITAWALFIVIAAIFYLIYRTNHKGSRKSNKINIDHRSGLINESKRQSYPDSKALQSSADPYDFHKVLSDLHNACNNCSNIYSSMKCVHLASKYSELLNIRLHPDGVTPFHRVCFRGNETLIELMLARGADPLIKTAAGENAICMTIYYYLYSGSGDFNCLNIFYHKGYRLDYNDEWYGIFLNLAIKNNNKQLTDWLISHAAGRLHKSSMRASSAPL